MTRLENRVERLEAAHKPTDWRVWRLRPVREWPEEALEAFLCERLGYEPGAWLHSITLQHVVENKVDSGMR